MNNITMGTLEILEEKIENIKWQISVPFSFKRTGASTAINLIRKSSGILGKGFLKGTIFENKLRREWKDSFRRRIH